MFKFLVVLCCSLAINAQLLPEEAHPAPEPYAFAYSAPNEDGSSSTREETGDPSGRITGSYTLQDPLTGGQRRVEYVADENGFRASVSTNEIGTESQNAADAEYLSSAPTAAELVARYEASGLGRARLAAPAVIAPALRGVVAGGARAIRVGGGVVPIGAGIVPVAAGAVPVGAGLGALRIGGGVVPVGAGIVGAGLRALRVGAGVVPVGAGVVGAGIGALRVGGGLVPVGGAGIGAVRLGGGVVPVGGIARVQTLGPISGGISRVQAIRTGLIGGGLGGVGLVGGLPVGGAVQRIETIRGQAGLGLQGLALNGLQGLALNGLQGLALNGLQGGGANLVLLPGNAIGSAGLRLGGLSGLQGLQGLQGLRIVGSSGNLINANGLLADELIKKSK